VEAAFGFIDSAIVLYEMDAFFTGWFDCEGEVTVTAL